MALRRCQQMLDNRTQCPRTACWFKIGDVEGRYDACAICYVLNKLDGYTNSPATAPKAESEQQLGGEPN